MLRHLPALSRATVARQLISSGDAARDERRYALAAAFYREGLRHMPDKVRVRIQYAHMLKESGDLAGAEKQYAAAAAELPGDADLALQIGHFHKVAGRPALAEQSYRRALEILPGWPDAQRELTAVGGLDDPDAGAETPDWVVPQLLPSTDPGAPIRERDTVRLFQFGRASRGRPSALKRMRGMEAIRGYRMAPPGLTRVHLLLDGDEVGSDRLVACPPPDDDAQYKYVFNIWHDFAGVAEGVHRVELLFSSPGGEQLYRHRERILVVAAADDNPHSLSDAEVFVERGAPSAETAVNALPSVIRTTARDILGGAVRSILVQRADQLGDLVASVPAIYRLRALFPDARIVGLVTTANARLAESMRLFDEIVVVPFTVNEGDRRALSVEGQNRLRRALARFAFDLAIDLGENDESRPLLLLSGARFLYGFKDRHSPWLDAGLDFNAHDPGNGKEIVPPSRKLVLLIEGLAALRRGCAVVIPYADAADLTAWGIQPGDRYAILHTGARLAFSRWAHFDQLAAMLLARTDLKVILFADDAERSDHPAGSLHDPTRMRVIAGQIPFDQFDAMLARCTIFVGNDSGPKHLAALRGAPVISLHMARLNWSEWGQEGQGRIISRRVPCAGCGIAQDADDCGKAFACLQHIAPEEVFAAITQVIAEAPIA